MGTVWRHHRVSVETPQGRHPSGLTCSLPRLLSQSGIGQLFLNQASKQVTHTGCDRQMPAWLDHGNLDPSFPPLHLISRMWPWKSQALHLPL